MASEYSFVDCMYCDFSHCTSLCPVELLKKSTVGFQSKSIHYQNWNAGDTDNYGKQGRNKLCQIIEKNWSFFSYEVKSQEGKWTVLAIMLRKLESVLIH